MLFIKLNANESTDKVINYKITTTINKNSVNLLIKLNGVRLPFNVQKYNNNLYLNIEMFANDEHFEENNNKIISLEKCIKEKFENNLNCNEEFISSIKQRSNEHVHLKTMCKRVNKNLMINISDNIDLYKLNEYHLSDNPRYSVEVKPDFIWRNNDAYGINFIICSIINI